MMRRNSQPLLGLPKLKISSGLMFSDVYCWRNHTVLHNMPLYETKTLNNKISVLKDASPAADYDKQVVMIQCAALSILTDKERRTFT